MATQTISKRIPLSTCNITLNSSVVTVGASNQLFVGTTLLHAAIPSGSTITAITSYTSVTISNNATANAASATIIAMNPSSVNVDDIAKYDLVSSVNVSGWSSGDILTVTDNIIVNVTTDQTKFWKTINVNNGKLYIGNTSTSNGISFSMGRNTASTANAIITALASSVEISGNWIQLGTGDGNSNQAFTTPFRDYIPAVWVQTSVGSSTYEVWLNATGAYSDLPSYWWNGLSLVMGDECGKFFTQTEASSYHRSFTLAGGSSSNASRIVTVTSTTGVLPGASISGTGITANSVVQRVVSSTQLELNITPTTSAGPNTYTCYNPPRSQLTNQIVFGDGVNGKKIPTDAIVKIPNIMITDLSSANNQAASNTVNCSFTPSKGNFTANIALFDESYNNFNQAQTTSLTYCGFNIPFQVSECYNFTATDIAISPASVRAYYGASSWGIKDFRFGQATCVWSLLSNAQVNKVKMAVHNVKAFSSGSSTATAPAGIITMSNVVNSTFQNMIFVQLQPARTYQVAINCSALVSSCTFNNIYAYGLGVIHLATSSDNTITNIYNTLDVTEGAKGFTSASTRVIIDPTTGNRLVNGTKYYFKIRSFRQWDDMTKFFEGRIVSYTPYVGSDNYHPWALGVLNTTSGTNTATWKSRDPTYNSPAFELYRGTSAGFTERSSSNRVVTTNTATTTTLADSTAVNSTTYYYVVRKYNYGFQVANCSGTSGQYTITTSNNFKIGKGTVANCNADSGSKIVKCLTGNFISSVVEPGMPVSGPGITAGTKVAKVDVHNMIELDTVTESAVTGAVLSFGVRVGMLVTGTNVGVNAKVVSIDSNTQITVDVANGGTVSGAMIFYSFSESAEQEVYTKGADSTASNYCFNSTTLATTTNGWAATNITATNANGALTPCEQIIATGTPTTTSCRLVSGANNGTLTQTVSGLTSSTQYTASIYVLCVPTATVPSVSGSLTFGTTVTNFTANLKWQLVTATFTTSTTSATVTITMNTTTQTLYVCHASVNLGASALPIIITTAAVATLNPAAREISSILGYTKATTGEGLFQGVELTLAADPVNTKWSEIYMGTSSSFTPSVGNMVGSTLDTTANIIGLISSNNNTFENLYQTNVRGKVGNLVYMTGSSNNRFINFNYDLSFNNTAVGVLVTAADGATVSSNNLFHNWGIKNLRNIASGNYPTNSINNNSNFVFQNIRCTPYDLPHSISFNNCILKGVSGVQQQPATNATTIAIGSAIDGIATAYTAQYDYIFNELYTGTSTGILSITFNDSAVTPKPYNIISGAPKFDNNGSLFFFNSGDSIEYIWPHKIYGVNGFMKRMLRLNGTDLGNDATLLYGLKIEYAIKTGTNYGDYKVATPDNLYGESVSASNGFYLKIKITSRSFMKIGAPSSQFVIGETITGVSSGVTAVVAGVENFGSVANTILITGISGGTFMGAENLNSGATLRAANVATNSYAVGPSYTSCINGLLIFTTVDQSVLYPVITPTVTLTGLQSGSEVRAYLGSSPDTSVLIDGIESSGNEYSFTHPYPGQSGYIVIFAMGFQPLILTMTYPTENSSIPIQQVIDRNYLS